MVSRFYFYVAIFFAVTAAIEAFYVCIFVWRFMTTGRKNSYRNRVRKRNNRRMAHGDAENAYSSMSTHESNNENRLGIRLQFPSFWDDHQAADGSFKIVPLNNRSLEYQEISSEFKRTLPDAKIDRIERIQNKILWSKYMDCARRCSENNKDDGLGEMLLFYGTRQNNPRRIYEDGTGFNINKFSQPGLWGRGIYFAVNASYSDESAFVNGTTCQLLAVNVLTGRSYYSKPDGNLEQPPLCPEDRNGGVQRRYDCVCGDAQGSRLYIMYENDGAYPMYVITYTRK